MASLAEHRWAHLLQIGSFDISSHSWRWTELFPVVLHSSRWHAVTTTTAFVRLWSLVRTDHSSIHSRQSHIHSFRRRGMERPAGSRHSCAVTRGLQTAPEDISVLALISWHCQLTYKLCIWLLYLCGPSNNFIIQATSKYWWWWWWWWWCTQSQYSQCKHVL